MEFLNIIKKLIHQYEGNITRRKNNTLLLGPGHIPKCEHMLYAPLPRQYYEEHLIKQYKNKFPEEYLFLLEHVNGCDLCTVRLVAEKYKVAHSLLHILGLPITPPFARESDMEEPYDLRIEDLDRKRHTPDSWLKFGIYTPDYNFDDTRDLYIDTETSHVYASNRNGKKLEVYSEWDSIDECLCSIYDSIKDFKEEYPYKPSKRGTNQGTVQR